jgi:lipopolysaccharide/colanic/teichoic acid biosynthesis glycosyltransferase
MQNESPATETRFVEATASKAALHDFVDLGGRSNARKRGAAKPSGLFRYRYVKRVVDLLVILVSLPVLLLAILIVAMVVKATSPGPIFFSHRRICRDGAFFSMWKFRTMCLNSSDVLEKYLAKHPKARAEWNKTHKLRTDPRITPVGHFLRRYSLDELPQAWNVVMGQMSIVGPRPIVAAEVEKYGEFFEFYSCVKPGVTGLWQVSGRSRLSYDARVRLDREYVLHWSLLRDLKILTLTCKSVVNRDGAY